MVLMAEPTLIEKITLDTLLEGYSAEPLISTRYDIVSTEDRDRITLEILSGLSRRFGLDEGTCGYLEFVIGEAVQNILQHCCGSADVKVYASKTGKGFIGAFELGEDAQFGREGHERYRQVLSTALRKSASHEFDRQSHDFLCSGSEGDCRLEEFYIGTTMILRSQGTKQLGIADIGGRAYFFFEYSLN
jgi:hypothetical protein